MSNQLDYSDGLLDRALDRALASYTSAAPIPGLENRIRARLAEEAAHPERRHFLFFGWGWADVAGFAAAVVLAAVLVHFHAQVDSGNLAGGLETQRAAPSAEPHLAASPPRFHRPHAVPAAASRQRPIGIMQRQLIAQLMAGGPETIASLARAAEEEAQPIALKPIAADPLVIEPIRIAPIDIDPLDD